LDWCSKNWLKVDTKPLEIKQNYLTQTPPTPPVEKTLKQAVEGVSLGSNPQNMSLAEYLNYIILSINIKTGVALSMELQNFRNRVQEELGYISLLNPINLTITELSQIPVTLSATEKQSLMNKINFWKSKLN